MIPITEADLLRMQEVQAKATPGSWLSDSYGVYAKNNDWIGSHGVVHHSQGGVPPESRGGDGGMTPTARSLAYLRKQGFHAYVVERWIPRARVRKDVAGFMDILAWRADPFTILAVQATTSENVSHRIQKIVHGLSGEDEIAFVSWKAVGNLVVVHGWAKQGPRGKRKLWTLREVWL